MSPNHLRSRQEFSDIGKSKSAFQRLFLPNPCIPPAQASVAEKTTGMYRFLIYLKRLPSPLFRAIKAISISVCDAKLPCFAVRQKAPTIFAPSLCPGFPGAYGELAAPLPGIEKMEAARNISDGGLLVPCKGLAFRAAGLFFVALCCLLMALSGLVCTGWGSVDA